ncbi:unnamed protein product [Closterium sp. Yama58-4]|nr:unnamed protein product [Closterium sp. Yama58-4]
MPQASSMSPPPLSSPPHQVAPHMLRAAPVHNQPRSVHHLRYLKPHQCLLPLSPPHPTRWHLTCYARRLFITSLAVFACTSPETQLSVTLPLQAIHIGLHFAALRFSFLPSLPFTLNCRWHLSCYARRLFIASISVFACTSPETQLSVTLPLQAIHIGLHFAASPHSSLSLDLLSSLLALSELLFTVALTGKSYVVVPAAATALFVCALVLLLVPATLVLLYEMVNGFIACTEWTHHLAKSQLYAVLSQALLGAAVGDVTVARMTAGKGDTRVLSSQVSQQQQQQQQPQQLSQQEQASQQQQLLGVAVGGGGMPGLAGVAAAMERGGVGSTSGRRSNISVLVRSLSKREGVGGASDLLSMSRSSSRHELPGAAAGAAGVAAGAAGVGTTGIAEAAGGAAGGASGGSIVRSGSSSQDAPPPAAAEATAWASAIGAYGLPRSSSRREIVPNSPRTPASIGAYGLSRSSSRREISMSRSSSRREILSEIEGELAAAGLPGSLSRSLSKSLSRSASRRERWNDGSSSFGGGVVEAEVVSRAEWPPRLEDHVTWTAAAAAAAASSDVGGGESGATAAAAGADPGVAGVGGNGDGGGGDTSAAAVGDPGSSGAGDSAGVAAAGASAGAAGASDSGSGSAAAAGGAGAASAAVERAGEGGAATATTTSPAADSSPHAADSSPQQPSPSSPLPASAALPAASMSPGSSPHTPEARLSVAELTLTFQRHLAILVRVEAHRREDSLRLLLRSDAVQDIISWLTSPYW